MLNKGLNLLAFGRCVEKPHFLAYPPPESCHGGFPRCLNYIGCSISLALWLNPIIYSVFHLRLILLNQLWGIFLIPLFVNSLGPSCWSKNSIISSYTCQLMWAYLILVNFDFVALINGWFNTLRGLYIWSYRGHTSPNSTHINAENVAIISFNSYQFLGGRLVSTFSSAVRPIEFLSLVIQLPPLPS